MQKNRLGSYSLIAICTCLTLSACISPQQRVATAVIEASRRNEPLPLARGIDETLTIAAAYEVQREFVREKWTAAPPAGFKAGLSTPQAQARFGATQPVMGVLPSQGRLAPGSIVHTSAFPGLTIETEVAMRLGSDITEHVRDRAQLQQHIDGIAPAIELPTLFYRSPERLGAIDLIATNVSAAAYVLGEFESPAMRDPNAAQPVLECNGTELSRGAAREALGDQWEAARWLVNTALSQGWPLKRGQILLTGTLGKMVPASPGNCSANYGSWGTIDFQVAP